MTHAGLLAAGLMALLLIAAAVAFLSEYVKKRLLKHELVVLAEDMALTESASGLGYFRRGAVPGKVRWSEGAYAVFGQDPKSFFPTSDSVRDFILPEYWPALDRLKDPEANGRRGGEAEVRFRHPNGSIRDLNIVVRYRFDRRRRLTDIFGVVVDITARKAAETQRRTAGDELVRSRESLQLAMEASQAGYFDIDTLSGAAYWSPRALEILGRDPAFPPTAAMLPTLVHPDDLSEFLAEREDFRIHGRPLDIEVRFRHGAGHYVWTHLRATSQSTGLGPTARVIGLIRDISQRRRAEQAVVNSEKKYRDLIDGSIQAILILEGRTPVFCNLACAQLFGYDSVEEMLARGSILPHLTPDGQADFDQTWATQMRGEYDGLVRSRQLVSRQGRLVHAEVVGRRVQWDGKPAWQVTMFDITERSRIEHALRASEERFRLLANNSSDVILVYDDTDVLTYASPSIELISGYTPAEVIGRTGLDLIYPADLPALLERRRNLRDGTQKPSDPLRWRVLHRNGNIRWVETTNAILPAKEGRKPDIVSASRDITERVEREVELNAAHDRLELQANDLAMLAQSLEAERERAEQANAAKSQFLAIMSHELRTPMTGVLGMADLLHLTKLDDEQRDLTQLLTRSAKMLLDLLNDILDFSKIEAGQLQIENTPFSVSDVIADVHNLFASPAAEKGLSLESVLPATYRDRVTGDPKRMRQVLSNLVNNAIKFTESGNVKVTMEQHLEGDDLTLTCSVTDTGIGIAHEDIGRLFAPFIQADVSTSRKFGGTGLGLAICKRLVEAMGGAIDVESEVGRGSRFTFSVKLHRAMVDATPPRSVAAALDQNASVAINPRHILLAEDNETSRYLIATMLQRHGHTVEAVEDGALALDAVRRRSFDIVLMDMQMPVMDGPEATREIRKLGAPRGAIPIIALTADIIAEHRKLYIQSGVNAVVGKPVNWLELEREIDRILGGAGGAESVMAGKAPAVKPFVEKPASEILDEAAVSLLAESLGDDILATMLSSFMENMTQYREDLRAAVAAGDLKKTKRVAHALKGLCAQFGAPRVADLARFIEDQAKDLGEVQPRLGDIEAAVTATNAGFLARRDALMTKAKAS